jgi:signal transduction histidine kinase
VQQAINADDQGHRVTHVVRVADGLRELAGKSFDIVLTDLTLPDAVQLESVQRLRAFDPKMPLIVLTSLESQRLDFEALQAGTQDYIAKDLMTEHLLWSSIRHSIERQKILDEKSQLIATLESQQQELNQSNEKLKQLVETAHRFVDNVSHEFRTPLTVVREYASLMRDGMLGDINDEQAEFLDVIGYRVDDLNTMVDDMLDSSKLEVGIMGVHRVSATAADIVNRSLSGLQLKAQVRGVELTFEPDADLPPVFCDPEKASRVVTNLVSNAIKFCDEDCGQVHVGIEHDVIGGDIKVSVSDNGPGIDTDGLSRMFERFQQLGTSTQSSTKGFGLGLNIARELVDLNYGVISVDSEVGKGTTFRFTVPVDDWPEIIRRYTSRLARGDANATIIAVQADADDTNGESVSQDIDAFWRFTERQPDLIRKTDSATWTLLIACDVEEIDGIIEKFKSNHKQVSRNRPQPLPALSFSTLGCFTAAADAESLIEEVNRDVVLV